LRECGPAQKAQIWPPRRVLQPPRQIIISDSEVYKPFDGESKFSEQGSTEKSLVIL